MNKRTLFIIITVSVIVLIIIGGMISSNYIKNKITDNLITDYGEQEKLIASQVAQTIEIEILSLEKQLYFISELPEIKYGDTDECNAKLDQIKEGGKTKLGNLGRVDADGTFKCSVNRALVGTEASKLGPYITKIFEDPLHEPVMSRSIKPAGATSFLVAVHVPVFGDEKEFLGTLGGAIYLNDIQQQYISNVQFAKDGFINLYDDDGSILYNYKTELIGKNIASPEFQSLVTNGTPPEKTIADIKAGVSKVTRFGFDSQEKVGASAPVNLSPERKWRVSVSVPIATIKEDLAAIHIDSLIRQLTFYITMIVGVFGIILWWIIDRKVFIPIKIVTKTLEKMGAGDTSAKVPFSGNDEIGTLAAVFNSMSEKINAANITLEKKVKERTEEIEKINVSLRDRSAELELLNNVMLDRELKMSDLKKEIAKYKKQ
ncbi:MAG: cache domain-containing protein [Patescibacteria group bacterium]